METVGVKAEPTFIEASATGALMVELDAQGEVLRVQIEPEVMASWSATVLADRITRLHRLALMRARAAGLSAMNERLSTQVRGQVGDARLAPSRAWPAQREADEYRGTIDF
jgi:DNA-binding protein YbaB